MALENIIHNLRKNKWLRTILLTLSSLFVLEGTDLLFNKKEIFGQVTIETRLSDNKNALELFNKGVEYYIEGNIDLAVDYLKKATDIDNKFAEAYDKLSFAYIEKGTVFSRALAEIAIKRAIKLEPDNVTYRIHYGQLILEQRFIYNSRRYFELLKDKYPKNTEVNINLGLIYRKELEYFSNMVSVDSRGGGIVSFITPEMLSYIYEYEGTRAGGLTSKEILSQRDESTGRFADFSSYAEYNYINAVDAFSEVLEIDPDNKIALHNLGILALDADMIDKFIDYQKIILENNPDDKDARLYLGYGYHKQSKDDLAFIEYKKAESLMHSDERAVFESIEYIVPSDEIKGFINLASAEKSEFERIFWRQKDPLFLSEYNERLLEHYSRVAYANLKFGVERKNIPGWKTDRGKIYIRYGPPNRAVRIGAEYREKRLPGTETMEIPDLGPTEVWYYKGFNLAFTDSYANGDLRLGAHSRFPGINFPEIAEETYREKPEIYQPQFPGKIFDFDYYTASFRGNNGKSLVEVYYALPVNDLNLQEEKDYKTITFREGIFFFDDKWNEVNKSIIRRKTLLSPELDPEWNFYLIGQNQLEIEPGEYNFAIEFQEEKAKNTGAYRQKLKVDSYPFGELNMSDIVLASSIDTLIEDSRYAQRGLRIIPNPIRIFNKEQLMHIYFEIYNLMVNPGQKTEFMVEYKISTELETMPLISRIFSNIGKLVGMSEGKQDITASYEYEGSNPTEDINLSIDMSATKVGVYTLTITITDLNNNKKVSKDIRLGIGDAYVSYFLFSNQ